MGRAIPFSIFWYHRTEMQTASATYAWVRRRSLRACRIWVEKADFKDKTTTSPIKEVYICFSAFTTNYAFTL